MSVPKSLRIVAIVVAWLLMLAGATIVLLDIGSCLSVRPSHFGGPMSVLGLFIVISGVLLRLSQSADCTPVGIAENRFSNADTTESLVGETVTRTRSDSS
jgi:hypothetical protein